MARGPALFPHYIPEASERECLLWEVRTSSHQHRTCLFLWRIAGVHGEPRTAQVNTKAPISILCENPQKKLACSGCAGWRGWFPRLRAGILFYFSNSREQRSTVSPTDGQRAVSCAPSLRAHAGISRQERVNSFEPVSSPRRLIKSPLPDGFDGWGVSERVDPAQRLGPGPGAGRQAGQARRCREGDPHGVGFCTGFHAGWTPRGTRASDPAQPAGTSGPAEGCSRAQPGGVPVHWGRGRGATAGMILSPPWNLKPCPWPKGWRLWPPLPTPRTPQGPGAWAQAFLGVGNLRWLGRRP